MSITLSSNNFGRSWRTMNLLTDVVVAVRIVTVISAWLNVMNRTECSSFSWDLVTLIQQLEVKSWWWNRNLQSQRSSIWFLRKKDNVQWSMVRLRVLLLSKHHKFLNNLILLLQLILVDIVNRRIFLFVLTVVLLVTQPTYVTNYMDIHQATNLRILVARCSLSPETIPTLLKRMILGTRRKRMLLLWSLSLSEIPQTINRMWTWRVSHQIRSGRFLVFWTLTPPFKITFLRFLVVSWLLQMDQSLPLNHNHIYPLKFMPHLVISVTLFFYFLRESKTALILAQTLMFAQELAVMFAQELAVMFALTQLCLLTLNLSIILL